MIRKKHPTRKEPSPRSPQKTEGVLISQPLYHFAFLILLISFFASGYFMGKTSGLGAIAVNPTPAGGLPTTQSPPPVQKPQQNLDALAAVTDQDHIRGSQNADVVLVEYSDFQCPYCQRFHATMQQIVKDYEGRVAWVLRNYPLPFHDKAQKTAQAAECVAEVSGNDAYWQMADSIFNKMPDLQLSDLADLAQKAGVTDKVKFQNCLDSAKFADKIKAETTNGQQAGIQGTPGTIIVAQNGKKAFIGGALPIEQVKQQIDQLL